MWKVCKLSVCIVICVAVSGFSQEHPYRRDSQEVTCMNSRLLKEAEASVVSVQAYVPDEDTFQWRVGTGFVYDKNGFIITRMSVIQGGDSIVVTMTDGRRSNAWVVHFDETTGLAILKLPFDDLPVMTIGGSAGLKVSSHVSVLGNSLGVFPSLTLGSYLGKRFDGMLKLGIMIPPGNCGSPVLDETGRLIGMLMGRLAGKTEDSPAVYEESLALPIETVREVAGGILERLDEGGGWIGIFVVDLLDPLLEGGVRVVGMAPGGPTDRAGICKGDTIVKFEGRTVTDAHSLAEWVKASELDREVTFTVLKMNQERDRVVRIGQKPWTKKRKIKRPR